MALARARRAQRSVDYWPGFVDALSTMLLVIIFLLSVFMLSQFFLYFMAGIVAMMCRQDITHSGTVTRPSSSRCLPEWPIIEPSPPHC